MGKLPYKRKDQYEKYKDEKRTCKENSKIVLNVTTNKTEESSKKMVFKLVVMLQNPPACIYCNVPSIGVANGNFLLLLAGRSKVTAQCRFALSSKFLLR